MRKIGIFIVCNIANVFSAEITYQIQDEQNKKLYEDTIGTLNSYGLSDVVFNVDDTIRIHPYKDYATTFSTCSNLINDEYVKLSSYKYEGYKKYFNYTTNDLLINYTYEELSNNKITVTNINTANIEYKGADRYKDNETYINAIADIKKNLFKDEESGFIILRDHYNIFVNTKYPFLSVDYDKNNNKITVKCDSKELKKYDSEGLYYTVTLKIPEEIINDKTKKGYILQYKKEDLEKIKIEIRSNNELKYSEINSRINAYLKKLDIPTTINDVYLLDKKSNKVTNKVAVAKGSDYTFYSDDLFIKNEYKKKSDELKAELDRITNILSNIPISEVVKITDIKKRENLINALYNGMQNIINNCVKYSADKIVNKDEYNNGVVGKEFIDCNHFKEKMKNSFDYLANLYIFLSTIKDVEDVIEKIKANDLKFYMSDKIFDPLEIYTDKYFGCNMEIYVKKVKTLLNVKKLGNKWNKYIEKLTEDLTIDNIFWRNKYNKDFYEIYKEKNNLFSTAVSNYYNTQYKALQVKINNAYHINNLGNYDLRDDNNYTYSLKVRPDLYSSVTFKLLKKYAGKFSDLYNEISYLFTIYDKNGKYIGYDLNTKIEQDYVTFNTTIQYNKDECNYCYVGGLDKFKEMKENFKKREIKAINKFTGKATDFKTKYETVLKQTEYLTLSDNMYEMKKEKEPYYLPRFRSYLLGDEDIDGNEVKNQLNRNFYSFSDCNILIINEINNAAIEKYNKLQEAEMDEENRKTVSELKIAVENSKNKILGVINSASELEKIKNYSTTEKIKAELENTVKNKVVNYDTKKAKCTTIDLFTNPVDEIAKAYKTKENAILEEKRKQQQPPIVEDDSNEEEGGKGEEEGKDKPTEEDNTPNPTNAQNTTNGTESINEQQHVEQKSKKCCCCNCKKNV